MATTTTLKAGQTLAVTVREGRAHIRCAAVGVSTFTRSSASFGPYLIETNWSVDGDATVSVAEYTAPFGQLVLPNLGAPDDATQASLTTSLTGLNNDLVFTARAYGAEGNSISVAYTDPGGTTAALAVSVFRQAITVSLARTANAISSTSADIAAAIAAHGEANELVTVANSGGDTGAGVVTALTATALTGGAGTGIGVVAPGGLCIDTDNGNVYRNSGSTAAPAWTQLADAA